MRVERTTFRVFKKYLQTLIASIALIISLTAWVFASPIGSSPDDDFHLVSIWCSSSAPSELCAPGSQENLRVVPKILISAPCYAYKPEMSASCLEAVGYAAQETVETDRGNFVGGYPPIFYWTMGLFASSDFQLSVLVMRFINVLIFVALSFATFLLLPISRKGILLWSYLGSSVPLGVFLITSNNPSSWAFIGVGISWIAFLGFVESTKKLNKIGLGIITLLATVVAAGSRADAAAYVALGIVVVMVIKSKQIRIEKNRIPELGLILSILLICLFSFVSANQSISAINGFGNPVSVENGYGGEIASISSERPSGFSLLAYNALNMPLLWEGMLGSWGLGWLDTDMPGIVHLGSLAIVIALVFVGIGYLNKVKVIALLLLITALFALPLYVLTKGGAFVGTEVQPRYILPLLTVFIGVSIFQPNKDKISLSRGQLLLIACTLSIINFVALQFNIRRYVTGIDQMGFNLDDHFQWWWNGVFSPMTILFIGSVSFTLFCFISIREINLYGPKSEKVIERINP